MNYLHIVYTNSLHATASHWLLFIYPFLKLNFWGFSIFTERVA